MLSQAGRSSHYLRRTDERRNSIYSSMEGQKFVIQYTSPVGEGSYGKVYRVIKGGSSSEEKTEEVGNYIVKHMAIKPKRIQHVKREVDLCKRRYGFGEVFYQPNDEKVRVVMPKLPGQDLTKYRFTDELDFLRVFILTQIETYFLHTKFHIMHGDIKFPNLLYSAAVGVLHCDFGLSRTLGKNGEPSEKTAGLWDPEITYLHPGLGGIPTPLASEHFDVYSLGQLVHEFDKVINFNNANRAFIAMGLAERGYIKYDEKQIQKPFIREGFLKDIYEGMTNLDRAKQWDLEKSISESIKLYNSLQQDPTKRMSLDLREYKPAELPSLSQNVPVMVSGAQTQEIPEDALLPLELNYQTSGEEKKESSVVSSRALVYQAHHSDEEYEYSYGYGSPVTPKNTASFQQLLTPVHRERSVFKPAVVDSKDSRVNTDVLSGAREDNNYHSYLNVNSDDDEGGYQSFVTSESPRQSSRMTQDIHQLLFKPGSPELPIGKIITKENAMYVNPLMEDQQDMLLFRM